MVIIFLLIFAIFLDFTLEYFLNKKYNLSTTNNKFLKILGKLLHYRIISISYIVFVSTFKSYNVGSDTNNYLMFFNSVKNGNVNIFSGNSGFEWLYALMNFIFAKTFGFRCMLFVIALFTSFAFYKFIERFSPNKLMSFILYVCLGCFAQSLNTLRQILAISIILFAIIAIYDKKILRSILLILVATLFHKSAIFGLIFVLFRFLKPNFTIVSLALSLTIIGCYVFPYLMEFVEKIFGVNYYTNYFLNYTEYIDKSNLLNNLYSVALIGIFFVLWIFRNKLKLNDNETKTYDYFLMIYLCVPLIRIVGFFMNAQMLFNRLSMYFFISLIVLIPLFLKGFIANERLKTIMYCGAYVISFGYMYYLYAIEVSCNIIPYSFCF